MLPFPVRTVFMSVFIALAFTVSGQREIIVKNVKKNFRPNPKMNVVYGLFIPRLDLYGGGSAQDIVLKHVRSGKLLRLRVKSALNSPKGRLMCFELPKGEYILQSYWYAEDKWLKTTNFYERLVKPSAASLEQSRYRFRLDRGEVYYIGTWDFTSHNIDFRNEKQRTDKAFHGIYKNLELRNCLTAIPD